MSDLKHILFFLIILSVKTSTGQIPVDSTENFQTNPQKNAWLNYIQLTAYHGHHLDAENNREVLHGRYNGVGVRLGKQSLGFKRWQQVHSYPQYGFGISYFDLGNKNVDQLFGKPISYYLFYGAPVFRFSNKFRLNADLEIGLATAFHRYDPDGNTEQDIIGAKSNLHANLSFEMYYELSPRIDLALGLNFIHFSSGRLSTPQKGINMVGFNLSSVYHYNSVRKIYIPEGSYKRPACIQQEIPRFNPFSEISIMAAIGKVQAEPGNWKHTNGDIDTTRNQGPRYFTNSVSLDYTHQFSYKISVMTGVDFFFDRSVANYYENKCPSDLEFRDQAFYGAHVGMQYVVGKISLLFQYGRYLYKPFEERGKWYIRCGGRFELTPHLDAQLSLKTRDARVSDWIEWGLLYKLRWRN